MNYGMLLSQNDDMPDRDEECGGYGQQSVVDRCRCGVGTVG